MIIDCHGHYTTAYRRRMTRGGTAQVAAFRAGEAVPPYPQIHR